MAITAKDVKELRDRTGAGMMECKAALAETNGDQEKAIDLLRANPDISFAVHLSVIRDIPGYDWGPLAPKDQVPSLLAEDGKLYTTERMAEMLERARLDELEIEFRAQIAAVLASGLRPTHLDGHCLHSGGRADIFAMTMALGR